MVRKFNTCIRLRDLRELVDYAAEKYNVKPAFKEIGPDRQIIEHNYNQLKFDIAALGTKLLADGLEGKHFALIGESTYNYVLSYLSVANGAGVIVPIDKELTMDDMIKLIRKSDSEIIFFSDCCAPFIADILAQSPDIFMAVNIGNAKPNCSFLSLNDLIDAGKKLLQEGDTCYTGITLDVDKNCSILFTSGTTGVNKGVMLCQRNLATTVYSALSLFALPDTSFSILPINHTYEFNIHVLGCIFGGGTLCFNDSLKHVKDNLKLFKPNMSLMVPMIVEGLYKNIWKETARVNLTSHLKYGIWFSNALRKIGIDLRKVLFAPVMENLGGQLNFIVCGGAPLNPDLIKGFDDIGISVYNGYGITECSPLISSNSPLSNVPGSVGVVVPGCTVRIGEIRADGRGEIQAKGDNVMLGYYKDDEATRLSFTDDGWFKTGDIGYMDHKGNLYITGRAKNLIILSNGKNVHPEELEEYIVSMIPYVREVVVYAMLDDHGNESVITAEAYLDQQVTQEVGWEKASEMFAESMKKVNRHLAAYKRITKTVIRETEFEKTTTKKIKRNVLVQNGSKTMAPNKEVVKDA